MFPGRLFIIFFEIGWRGELAQYSTKHDLFSASALHMLATPAI